MQQSHVAVTCSSHMLQSCAGSHVQQSHVAVPLFVQRMVVTGEDEVSKKKD